MQALVGWKGPLADLPRPSQGADANIQCVLLTVLATAADRSQVKTRCVVHDEEPEVGTSSQIQ
jgi:hypothetical protein